MGLTATAKFTGSLNQGNVVEVVRRDRAGRILRIGKYLFRQGSQRPVSEQIFDPCGNSILYLYDEAGKNIKQVVRLDKRGLPA